MFSGVAALQYISTPMASLVTITTLVLTGQPLTPVNVFMLVSFINMLRTTICTNLANALVSTYEAYASLGRIEEFLLLENLPSICPHHYAKGKLRLVKVFQL